MPIAIAMAKDVRHELEGHMLSARPLIVFAPACIHHAASAGTEELLETAGASSSIQVSLQLLFVRAADGLDIDAHCADFCAARSASMVG